VQAGGDARPQPRRRRSRYAPEFVDAIIEASSKSDVDPSTFRTAARWLGGGSIQSKAMDALRRAFDEKRCKDQADARGELITILAEHGDYRGLGEVFERLTEVLDDMFGWMPNDVMNRD
jgi:hypothetical protein